MKNLNSSPGPQRRVLPAWLNAAMLGAGLSLLSGTSQAAIPPAGTQIGNQAQATFVDSAQVSRSTKSNNVLTIVQQVGNLNIGTGVTKSGQVGTTVNAQHSLRNNGNGTERFKLTLANSGSAAPPLKDFSIYQDTTGTGVPSGAALCGPTATAACNDLSISIAAGESYNLIIGYNVPGNAAQDWVGEAKLSITPEKPEYHEPPGKVYILTDQISVATGAVFELTKQIGGNLPTAPDGKQWPTTINNSEPSAESCKAEWPATSTAECHYTTYTITLKNNSDQQGRIAFEEALPDGLTYVAGSAVLSSKPGVALANQSSGDYTFSGASRILKFSTVLVGGDAPRYLSYAVLINSNAKVNDPASVNRATRFGTVDCPSGNVELCKPANSNVPEFRVNQTYKPVISALPGYLTPDKPGATNETVTVNDDLLTQASVPQNGTVTYKFYVANQGNGEDTFNFSIDNTGVSSGGYNFPAGTRFHFSKQDGNTPLLDTNNDGIDDSGPLKPSEKTWFYVDALLPRDAKLDRVPLFARVVASSSAARAVGKSVTDTVWLRLEKVTSEAAVDLTNTRDSKDQSIGKGPGNEPTYMLNTTPGVQVTIPLVVTNNDSKDLQFKMTASPDTLKFPGTFKPGWEISFRRGTSCTTTTAVETTDVVLAGKDVDMVACVTPPAGVISNSYNQAIYFRAESTGLASNNQGLIHDTIYNQVTVAPTPIVGGKLLLTSDQKRQVAPGGSVSYTHTLSNIGTDSCKLNYNISEGSDQQGWNYAIKVTDVSTGSQSVDITPTAGSLLPSMGPNSRWRIEFKISAPPTALNGYIDKVKLSFQDIDSAVDPVCGYADTVNETTVIGTAEQLALRKEITLDESCAGDGKDFSENQVEARPGKCVLYRITGRNAGAGSIKSVWIFDAVPAFTTINSSTKKCTTTGKNGVRWGDVDQSSFRCGSDDAVLEPGETVTMQFGIKLNPQ